MNLSFSPKKDKNSFYNIKIMETLLKLFYVEIKNVYNWV